jgi:hypothetical protein
MIRLVTSISILLIALSAFGQSVQRKPTVVRDAFGELNFHESTLDLTEAGSIELEKFSSWYLLNSKTGLPRVFLSGLVTQTEVAEDSFIGVKRCKVIIDALVGKGVNTSFFFIANDRIDTGKKIGVGFVLDAEKKVMLESENEDDYFKEKNKKRKKG